MLYNLCNCPLKIGCCLMFSKSVNWSLRSWLNLQKSFRTSNVCSLVLSNKIVKRSYLVSFNSWMTVVWVKWNKIKIKMTYTLQLVIRDFTYQLNDKKLHNVQKRVSYRLDHYLWGVWKLIVKVLLSPLKVLMNCFKYISKKLFWPCKIFCIVL